MNEWLDNTARLSLDARRLEKKYAPSVNDEGYREYHASAVIREQTNHKKYKQITHFQAALDNIGSTLRNMENDKLDCVYFQNLLEGFESKLSIFKATMAKEFEELIHMEQHLTSDLSTFEEHVNHTMMARNTGSTLDTAAAAGAASLHTRKQQEEVKKRNEKISAHKAEIGAIERKLTSLGDRLGGWDSRDHDIFVRVWTQYVAPIAGASGVKQQSQSRVDEEEEEGTQKQKEKEGRGVLDLGSKTAHLLRRRLVQAVQMKSEEEIEEHLLWFMEVDALLYRKKEILSIWKREKERAKPDALSSSTASSPGRNTSAATLAMSDRKRELNKQRVAAWQQDREEKQKQNELRVRRQQEEHKRSQEREKAERQQNNRVLVQNWVEERKAKEHTAAVAASARPDTAKVTNANLDTLRRKQEQEIDKAKTRRVQLNTARERAASTGRLRRQKQLAESTTDPSLRAHVKSKLHEPTKVSLASRLTAEDLETRERQRSGGSAHNARVVSGGYDLKFTGRAIPAWTRGAGLM